MKPEYAMRGIDAIAQADLRSESKRTLIEHHTALDQICVVRTAPKAVKRLFATARNLSLYAYFVREFHPIARLVGFIALEVALNRKWEMTHGAPPDEEHQTLRPLLKHAVERGWIRTESFSWVKPTAKQNTRVTALNRLYAQHPAGGFEPPDVDDAAVQREIDSWASWASEWADTVGELRNKHAHGELKGTYQSEGVLRLIVDAVNGMFAPRARQPKRPPSRSAKRRSSGTNAGR